MRAPLRAVRVMMSTPTGRRAGAAPERRGAALEVLGELRRGVLQDEGAIPLAQRPWPCSPTKGQTPRSRTWFRSAMPWSCAARAASASSCSDCTSSCRSACGPAAGRASRRAHTRTHTAQAHTTADTTAGRGESIATRAGTSNTTHSRASNRFSIYLTFGTCLLTNQKVFFI